MNGNTRIISGRGSLTDEQNLQFQQAIVHGLRGKFAHAVQDEGAMLAIVDMWIRNSFLPMEETFCALDEATDEVVGILLMNNFKDPGLWNTVKSGLEAWRILGFSKFVKLCFSFLQLDTLNRKMGSPDVAAEIYLVAVREGLRGRGVGTLLMERALQLAQSKCRCGLGERCVCRAMLLVFNKNPARRLYERLGFQQTARLDTPQMAKSFGDDYDVLIKMEKPLKG